MHVKVEGSTKTLIRAKRPLYPIIEIIYYGTKEAVTQIP